MKRLLAVCGMAVAILGFGGTRAQAASVSTTIFDGTDVWTLTIADDTCTNDCDVTLSVEYDGSARTGDELLAIQWGLDGATVSDENLVSATQGTWTYSDGVVANGGCSGNNLEDACYNSTGADVIVADGTITWTFTADFSSTDYTAGLIRAAYDVDPDGSGPLGKNFSPGSCPFGQICGGEGEGSQGPEPASLLLFGMGLSAAGVRMRRARK